MTMSCFFCGSKNRMRSDPPGLRAKWKSHERWRSALVSDVFCFFWIKKTMNSAGNDSKSPTVP